MSKVESPGADCFARESSASAAPWLRVEGLQLKRGERILLDRLDFAAERGQRWAVLGANGIGKSTLLASMAGLRPITSGQIYIDGQALSDLPASVLARYRAFVEQGYADAFSQSVRGFVAQARSPYQSRWQFASSQSGVWIDEALAAMDLTSLAERDILELSGGERQRLSLAAALAQATPLMILDEPSSHLDPAHQLSVLNALCAAPDSLLVMALHDVNLALRYCSHAILLSARGCQAGPIERTVTDSTLTAAFACRARIISIPSDTTGVSQPAVLWG